MVFFFMMYRNLRDYSSIVRALRTVLNKLPGKIVAIGGGLSAGKTTLGRYLAYRFNVTLIESDLFRLRNETTRLAYRADTLAEVLASRVDRQYPRPVIVESAVILRLLSEIGRRADFYIHISSDEEDDVIEDDLWADVTRYHTEYRPTEIADVTVHFPKS